MPWFSDFYSAAAETDQLKDRSNHPRLLAAGLFGETGSVLAELKKMERERDAYPVYRKRLREEFGDLLWYFVRLVDVLAPESRAALADMAMGSPAPSDDLLQDALKLSGAVGTLLSSLGKEETDQGPRLREIWKWVLRLAPSANVELPAAAQDNQDKTRKRWPKTREYHGLLDEGLDEEVKEFEQLPRELEVEFRLIERGRKNAVILRCNGLNFGDRLTDNIEDEDFYRYHDIFHFAYAVHLGWSPVLRSLLRCKRKSKPDVDEAQDGARAAIIEEGVSAIVFSRAKEMCFFDGVDKVDYDLLKTIEEFVQGYEVDQIPLWQWEEAILDGYRVFRKLRDNDGGTVTLNLLEHKLHYQAPA